MSTIPDSYKEDSMGRLTRVERIPEIDLQRDELVNEKIAKMIEINQQLTALKRELIDDIKAFVDLSAEKYGVTVGGKQGNVTLLSYDGSAKLQLTIAKNLIFDERLVAAKALVDECIKEWTADANENLHVLIDDAFQVDKKGHINTQRIISLTRQKMDDPTGKWDTAMKAIHDSLCVNSTTTYVRGYLRDDKSPDKKMKPIVLDLAGV